MRLSLLVDDDFSSVAASGVVVLPPSLIFFVGGGASFSVPLQSMVLSAVLFVPDILSAPAVGGGAVVMLPTI